MQAIIMAAGQSTRTYPLTATRPKPLLKAANRPILEHQLDVLRAITDHVIVVVGYRREQIERAYGAEYRGMALTYVHQSEQRGTGHALLQCAGVVDGPFLAMNGDDLYHEQDIVRLAELEQGALAREVIDVRQYGVYETDKAGNATSLTEKPEQSGSTLANMGVYRFTPDVFDILRETPPSPRGEIEITSAIEVLIQRGGFRVLEAEGYWLPIGYPWHLLEANEFLLNDMLRPSIEGEISPAAHIMGAVAIGRGTTVRPGAVIEGPSIIGANCVIGPNCWIRPGTSIADNCKIGQGVEIKNSIIMDNTAVPHLSYVGDSILGEGVNLGCGTITANLRHDGRCVKCLVKGRAIDTGRRKLGAIIGDGVHTGTHTSIYPGRKLWPHTATAPGAVVQRDVESEDNRD
ncbi:MAG: bifunctional sugar-1-phosphate nucleotidylyltransferase/acetyltransferase [Candidatus Hydrogenedentota bacterium]